MKVSSINIFTNGYEDHGVNLFFLERRNYALIHYKIDDYMSSFLGTYIPKELRNTASLSFLNYKYEKIVLQTR